MKIIKNKVWAIIPARGGSKTIPLKNMVNLAGKPLIQYVTNTAKASRTISRTICSTDNKKIADYCKGQKIEVHHRPANLSEDETPVLDVLVHLIKDIYDREGEVAEIIVLLQPTSPFTLGSHVDDCVEILKNNPEAQSSQTVVKVPHNFHAYNQRRIDSPWIQFCFPGERKVCYNKQTKPVFYMFGNLVVTRCSALVDEGEIFGTKSLPLFIPFSYALDVDGPDELELAEWYLANKKIDLK